MDGRRAVFLDRDGTINEQVGYCGEPDRIRLIGGAAEAVRRLNELRLLVIVVTNQSAVARGLISEAQVRRVNAEVALLVARASGGRFDAFYYCPHHPEQGHDERFTRRCECRKPGGGMLKEAARQFGIDLSISFLVGDADIDHRAGKAAHPALRTYQVPSDYNAGEGDEQAANLLDAAERIAWRLKGAQSGGTSERSKPPAHPEEERKSACEADGGLISGERKKNDFLD